MAKREVHWLGTGRIGTMRHGGRTITVFDEDSLRREGAGFAGFAGEDPDDWEDDGDGQDDGVVFGNDDFDGDDDDFDGDDDELDGEDDELDGEDDELDGEDELGAARRRRKARAKKAPKKKAPTKWAMTVVNGSASTTSAGDEAVAYSMAIRLQHHFKAQDLKVTMSVPSGITAVGTITSILFGDRLVFSSPTGVDVALFGTAAFTKQILGGQNLGRGGDILVAGNITASAQATIPIRAAFIGLKPAQKC